MEEKVVIDTPDGHKIYGVLNTPEEKPEKLVIFVHGFTGNCQEHIFFNGAKYLKQKGIGSFRFNLYDWQKEGRQFTDCNTQTHVDDLKTVLDYFKDKYPKVYLVGHSWGGIVVLESKLDVSGIILWDSSHISNPMASEDEEEDEYEYCKELDAYIAKWGCVFVIGKEMYKDEINIKTAKELMSWVKCPIKIISAGNGVLVEGGKDYYNQAKEPKELVVIEGAGHTFDEEGAEENLLQETADWVLRY